MKNARNINSQTTYETDQRCHLKNAAQLLADMAHSVSVRKAMEQLILALDSASIILEADRATLTNCSESTS